MSAESQNAYDPAQILSEALPYMQRYDNKVVVIKYGGHAMGDGLLSRAFARDVVLLKQSGINPVIVHGGGPQIGEMLERLTIKSEFVEGLRITDRATVEVVEMVLAGRINKQIVLNLALVGGLAVGLTGKDGGMVVARKLTHTHARTDSKIEAVIDLGFVGEPCKVDCRLIKSLIASDIIPVIAPVCPGEDGETYNVNADTFAGAVAVALEAERLLFMTDVPGVLDTDKALLKELDIKSAHGLIKNGVITGGMIPKVETCISAVEKGVGGVVIVNGRIKHAVLRELLTSTGAGTLIRQDMQD